MMRMAASLIEPCDTLVEAYSGVGGISLMLKEKAKTIIGIEFVPEAVENAKENARLNRAENVRFVCGDAAKEMKKIIRRTKIDAVVVDPPRTDWTDDDRKVCGSVSQSRLCTFPAIRQHWGKT